MAQAPTQRSIYLASICYGGLASVDFMRSVLELRAQCSAQGIPLQLDLMGGEALASRGEAEIRERFQRSGATGLVMVDSQKGFGSTEMLDADRPLTAKT